MGLVLSDRHGLWAQVASAFEPCHGGFKYSEQDYHRQTKSACYRGIGLLM